MLIGKARHLMKDQGILKINGFQKFFKGNTSWGKIISSSKVFQDVRMLEKGWKTAKFAPRGC